MNARLALAGIDEILTDHRGGHRCTDGQWYNPNAGPRTPCPTAGILGLVAGQIRGLAAQVHEAAHNDSHALQVGLAAVGYTEEELADTDQPDDDRQGVIGMGRAAIERLSEILDGEV